MPAKKIDWTVPGILGGLAAVLWLMAAGFYAFYSFLSGTVERVEAWPTTEAVVQVNHWETYQGRNLNTGKYEPMQRLRLEYSYEVDGKSYTGKEVNAPRTGGKFGRDEADAYPVGSRMPIRYDPGNPSVAGVKLELENEMKLGWFNYLIGGLVALGLLLFGFGTRSLLRQRAAKA
jgi:hypothetical protein